MENTEKITAREMLRGVNPSLEMKRKFIALLDGDENNQPLYKEVDSYKVGICRLSYDDLNGVLIVYARKPKLLSGFGGRQLVELSEKLGITIVLHDIKLSTFDEPN